MRRRREVPDAKVTVFPSNHMGDASAGASSWGADHSLAPLRAGEVVLVGRRGSKLLAIFTLRVQLGGGVAFYIRGCRLVQWGAGQRAFLPERSTTVKERAPDDDAEAIAVPPRRYFERIFVFDSNRGEKAFEEAMLSAARHAIDRHCSEQRERSPAVDADNGNVVPF